MPEKIGAKPCQRCGVLVEGIQRADKKSLRYPKHCDQCRPLARARRERHPRWRDTWRYVNPHTGYVYIRVEIAGKLVRRLEHRIVWERHHGPIPRGLHVHHINHDKTDNRIENLTLITPHGHNTLHHKISRWSIAHDDCVRCGTNAIPHAGHGLCDHCSRVERHRREMADGTALARRKYAPGIWARGYPSCVACGQTDREHVGKGLCQRCYYRQWETTRPKRIRRT